MQGGGPRAREDLGEELHSPEALEEEDRRDNQNSSCCRTKLLEAPLTAEGRIVA